jgi:PAS domain S-box-containing protein
VHDLNSTIGVVVTFVDITERRRAELALRESEARMRSILESSPNPITMTDREGNVVFMNRVGPGLVMRDVIGRPAWQFVVADDMAAVRDAVLRAIAGEVVQYETVGQSGRRYAVTACPVKGVDGFIGAAIASWDITELKSLQARLAIADRMASLGTLAAGVAHEINNPLTYTLANLSLLQRTLPAGDARAHAWIVSALEGVERIRSIVSDLSSFSHVGEGPPVALDVTHLLDSSIRMAENEIRYRARVVRRYGDTPPVLAHDSRLGQVFLNLLINAAHAIPEGAPDSHEIVVTTSTDAEGFVVVEIHDSGVGIPPELLDRIFDPFVTSKPKGVGTGLGLYICRTIVDSLAGELTVKSELGHGSTFRVRLRPAQPAAEPERAEPVPASGAPARMRILIVDDEPSIIKVMQSFLAPHEVEVARSGREAIAALSAADYDLAFCDLIMPDLTGMDVYSHLREHLPGREACLVFMTGGAFTDRAQRFLDTVSNQVIEKPFSLHEIEGIIATRAARPVI